MMLLWTFMSGSSYYTWFAGSVEVFGAALLLFRRTSTLGAAILFAALMNIVMLNLFYDVPAKLFAIHLLLASAYVLWCDKDRLIALFLFNQATKPQLVGAPGLIKQLTKAKPFVKAMVVITLTAPILWQQTPKLLEVMYPSFTLQGTYNVQNAHQVTNSSRKTASRVTFNSGTMSLWDLANTKLASYRFDITGNVLTLVDKSSGASSSISIIDRSSSTIEIGGEIDGREIEWQLKRHSFQLVEHEFHWITEFPHRK
jgi:hypothetical protein